MNISIEASFIPPKTERKQKGKSLITFPDTYCVIDIETTGLSPLYDNIIEISALKISFDDIVDTFSTLVRPFSTDGKYVDAYITALTGITNEMLSVAPTEDEVMPIFQDFIGHSVLLGHNVHFDINFLYDSFNDVLKTSLTNDFIDTMRIAKKLHSELEHHRLSDIADLYNIDYSSAHRSLEDCKITYNCYLHLKKDTQDKYQSLDNLFCKPQRPTLRAKDIRASTDEFDCSNPLYEKVIVFTGTLEKMARKDAMQLVTNLGGINGDNVTKKQIILYLAITTIALR